jgi:hypothetical protein
MMGMREFSPPVTPSVLRPLLAVLVLLVGIVPLFFLVRLGFGIAPPSYTIADGTLSVRSGDPFSGEVAVRVVDVTTARVVALRGARRTAGTALPGLCSGRFAYPDLGDVWQVTDCGPRGLLIEARGQQRPIVISPPDPEAFAQSLRANTPSAITLPPPDTTALRVLALVVGPLGLANVVWVSALLLFGPQRMRYRVGDGALEVRTLFGRKRWRIAGARVRGYTPARLWRVMGVAAPGYYTGRFRESGESTRVYATDVKRLVLVEGEERVMVSPEDPVGFLRALEEQGATVEHHA